MQIGVVLYAIVEDFKKRAWMKRKEHGGSRGTGAMPPRVARPWRAWA